MTTASGVQITLSGYGPKSNFFTCSYVRSYNDFTSTFPRVAGNAVLEDETAYQFEWNEAKNRSNIRKHGLDFADAEEMFRGVLVVAPDTREDYGEIRWIGIGAIRGRTAYVVFTEPDPGTIRIISLRKASRRESEQYEKAIEDRLEAGGRTSRFGH